LDLLERLTGVYDEQGQTDKAEELRQQIRDSASVLQTNHYFRSGGIFGQKIAGDEVPLFSTTDTMLAITPRPASARKHKIGRNEPCPCRSGKKFKKCCGRGVF
jgi:preprotein translocase subunit SecA